MDFITELALSTNWKGDSYNIIFIIINQVTKMVYYNPIKTIIDTAGLAKIINNMIIRYHKLFKSIVNN